MAVRSSGVLVLLMLASSAASGADPVVCYVLDGFLLIYCIILTSLLFRQKLNSTERLEDPNKASNDGADENYEELNLRDPPSGPRPEPSGPRPEPSGPRPSNDGADENYEELNLPDPPSGPRPEPSGPRPRLRQEANGDTYQVLLKKRAGDEADAYQALKPKKKKQKKRMSRQTPNPESEGGDEPRARPPAPPPPSN